MNLIYFNLSVRMDDVVMNQSGNSEILYETLYTHYLPGRSFKGKLLIILNFYRTLNLYLRFYSLLKVHV